MTSAVSGNAAPARTQSLPAAQPHRIGEMVGRPSAEDVRAMTEALGRAHAGQRDGQSSSPAQSAAGKGKGQLAAKAEAGKTQAPVTGGVEGHAPVEQQDEAGSDAFARGRDADRAERHGDALAFAGQVAAAQPQAVAPALPAPHVDASAFAQLMTQLWLREKDKGAKEISVRFGQATWPATGARLVRNAAGALDVELFVQADRAPGYGGELEGLRERFADNGITIGALAVVGDG